MYDLSAYNSGRLKSYFYCVLFLRFEKFFNLKKNRFSSIHIFSWRKIYLLTNIRNKCVIRKINLYFFDVIKHGQIFPSKACHSQYGHRLFFGREMGNNRTCKEVRLQKLVKFRLSRQYSFWHFSSCLKMNHSHFLQSVLIETSNVLLNFLCFTLPFLDCMTFRGFKLH